MRARVCVCLCVLCGMHTIDANGASPVPAATTTITTTTTATTKAATNNNTLT